MDGDSTRRSRRRFLQLLGAGGLPALAGCNQSGDSTGPTTESTETVVFTNSTTASTSTTTTAENRVVFDGGDARDFNSALELASRTPEATLEIAPGTYELSPVAPEQGAKPPHFDVNSPRDLTIEGNGATLVFTEPTRGAFRIFGGSGLTIRNLTLDHDPLPFTQGSIRDVNESDGTLVLELEDGYPSLDHEMFDAVSTVYATTHAADGELVTGIRNRGDIDKHFETVERVGDRRFELTLRDRSNTQGLERGRRLAVVARNNHAMFNLYKVDDATFENVRIRASNGGGFNPQVCDKPSIENCVIAPPDGSGRLLATNADGVRFVNCHSEPRVENSRFEYLGDDGIVVQHTLAPVTSIVDEHTVEVGNIHPFVAGAGDVCGIMAPDGRRKGTTAPISELSVRQRAGGQNTRAKPRSVTFEDPVPSSLEAGDLLGNLATASHEFVVRNNVLRNHRGRLVRIAASNGVVVGNTLAGSNMSALKLESEGTLSPFAPKGWVENVTVRDNDISRSGMAYFANEQPAGIRLDHVSPEEMETTGRPNRNVTIRGNAVSNSAATGIKIADARSVQVEENELRSLNKLHFSNFGGATVELDSVGGGALLDNEAAGSSEFLSHFCVQRESDELTTDGNELVLDGNAVAADVLELQRVTLTFNETSETTNRKLAFYCRKLSLLDDAGDTVHSVDVGGQESGIEYGEGVYGREDTGSDTRRWFGGRENETALFFAGSALENAASLVLYGSPYESGLEASVSVRGKETDTVSFAGSGPYEASLE